MVFAGERCVIDFNKIDACIDRDQGVDVIRE